MLYFQVIKNDAQIIAVNDIAAEITNEQRATRSWECRADWRDLSFEQVQDIATLATEHSGELYIGIDNGPHHPRFDVVRAPAVGDDVSYSFNGDTYPDGTITKVSASLRMVTTDKGSTYYRRGNTGRWVKKGGTWSLVRGHHYTQNPHF